MDQICLVVPITPGKTADAMDFMRELEEQRKPCTASKLVVWRLTWCS
jgi:hypothetical protein